MDVCVVTETWMITVALQLLHCLRKATLSAMFPVNLIGLVVVLELSFVTVHVSASPLSIPSKDLHMSHKVTANGHATEFVIIYRPPYSEAHPVSANVFFEEFAASVRSVYCVANGLNGTVLLTVKL